MPSRANKEYRGPVQMVSDAMTAVFDKNYREYRKSESTAEKTRRAKEMLGTGAAREGAEDLSRRKKQIEDALRKAGA